MHIVTSAAHVRQLTSLRRSSERLKPMLDGLNIFVGIRGDLHVERVVSAALEMVYRTFSTYIYPRTD
jgi:hypothetical protein